MKKPYQVLQFDIIEENGFNGAYKKVIATLKDSSRPGGKIRISLPPALKRLPDIAVSEIQKNIANGKYPIYTVLKINAKPRGDGKGTYDDVDFTFR